MEKRKSTGLTVKAHFVAWALLVCCPFALALDPTLDVSQYAHTSWKIRDGFPKASVVAIAQSQDGYLWLGTDQGLFQYDGSTPRLWQPPQRQHLPSDGLLSLLTTRDGTLWIGTFKGLASWKDGKLTNYPELTGDDVVSLIEGRDGTVWAAGWAYTPPGKLCAIRGAKIHCYGDDGSLGSGPVSLYEDRDGVLWVGTYTGVWRWKPRTRQFYSLAGDLDGIQGFAEDDRGLLIALGNRVARFTDGKFETEYANPPGVHRSARLLRDRDGGLWIGTADKGIVHVHQGRVDTFSQTDGLSGNVVTALFEDREGDIWVGTQAGLDRFRGYAIETLSAKEGLPNVSGESMLSARDGSIWVGVTDGLARWSKMGVQRFSGGGLTARSSLFEDQEGRIWVAGHDAVGYLKNDRFVRVSGIPNGWVYAMVQDEDRNLWIANLDRGLLQLRGDHLTQQIPWNKFGNHGFALALAADRSQSGLWLGFSEGGLAYFRDGQVRSFYGAAEGLGKGAVNWLQLDHEGALWAATANGLSRLKNGRITTLSSKNGLPCDAVNWVMEDDDGSLWLYMTCGLVRIPRSELNAWALNPDSTIHPTIFDSSDGVRSRGSFENIGPNVSKSPDGKIWFTTFDGLSIIDPHHLAFNKLPPPVHIEQVIADDKQPFAAAPGMRLPQHVHYLAINYTALSLTIPEKIHFKIKLEGEDTDWRELINVRHVEYTNLPPRHYRFRVIASNNSGVWNEVGDSLDFTIPPAWYQTWWFRLLCVLAFLMLLTAAYQRRIHQIQSEERKLRETIGTIPAMAWIAGPDGIVQFVNQRWVDYTGVSEVRDSHEITRSLMHPEDVERTMRHWQACVESGQPFEEETRFRGAAGQFRWFLLRAVPHLNRRGQIVKWYGTATDIEGRKHAEQLQTDLAHVNRVSTLGELAASISHELKQPITAAILNATTALNWLQRDPPNLTKVHDSATEIIEDGKRATEIIDRLRSLYKKSSPRREPLDLNLVISEMAVLLRSEATQHAVSMRVDLAENLPAVVADRVQIQQVLMNLMLNGIEAMNETGGVLMVRSELREDSQIEISVSDTGPGLPQDKTSQIFDAFFTTKPQGSGMGLAICKSIVESHGGRIWASGNGGRGATFHFTLKPATGETGHPGDVA